MKLRNKQPEDKTLSGEPHPAKDGLTLLDQLKNYLSALGDAVWVIDGAGNIFYHNDVAAKLFEKHFAKQFPLQDLNAPVIFYNQNQQDYAPDDFPVNQAIRNNAPVLNETVGMMHKGTPMRWFTLDCRPFIENQTSAQKLYLIQLRASEAMAGNPSGKGANNFFNNLPGMVYICKNEPEYRMIYVSDGAIDVTGYTAQEFLHGFNYESIIAEGYRKTVWNSIQQNLQAKKPFEITYRITHKDGREKWVWEKGKQIIRNGEVYLEGFITDITASRLAEENLRKSEKKYRLMAENTGDVIWTSGPALTFSYVSPSLEKLTGHKPEEVLEKDIISVLHQDSLKKAQGLINKYLPLFIEGEKEIISAELKHQCKNGNSVWAEVTVTPVFNHKKEFIGLVGVTRDVTEQRSIRRVLMESEARLRNLLETINLMAVSIASDGKIVFCNEYFTSISGYAQNEIIGKNWFSMFIPKEQQKQLKSAYYDTLFEGNSTTNHFESTLITKSGKSKLIKWNQTVFNDSDNHTTLITSVGEDVTEDRLAQKRELELKEILEARVRQRTSELEEANRDLEAFAYSISHDLRAPLRHIDGFVRMISADLKNTSHENERYFNKIYHASARMHQMINDLLSFSRIGRKQLLKTHFDFTELVNEIIDENKPETENRNIEWALNSKGNIYGDRNLLKSAVENLLSNAVKFTRNRNTAIIEIDHTIRNSFHRISITDNGVGFDNHYADKLFTVFQRLHTEAEYEGAGIGLANVKRIIQKHGGTITASAKVDEGATFVFLLPAS